MEFDSSCGWQTPSVWCLGGLHEIFDTGFIREDCLRGAVRCVVRARQRSIRAFVPQPEAVYAYCPPEEEDQRRRLFHNYCIGAGNTSWAVADRADSAVRFLGNALFSPDVAAWVVRIQELFPNCLHARTTHGAGALRFFIAQSVQPRTPEERARTPQQQADALRFLIESGADVNARDNRGRTPQDCARGNAERRI